MAVREDSVRLRAYVSDHHAFVCELGRIGTACEGLNHTGRGECLHCKSVLKFQGIPSEEGLTMPVLYFQIVGKSTPCTRKEFFGDAGSEGSLQVREHLMCLGALATLFSELSPVFRIRTPRRTVLIVSMGSVMSDLQDV